MRSWYLILFTVGGYNISGQGSSVIRPVLQEKSIWKQKRLQRGVKSQVKLAVAVILPGNEPGLEQWGSKGAHANHEERRAEERKA